MAQALRAWLSIDCDLSSVTRVNTVHHLDRMPVDNAALAKSSQLDDMRTLASA